MRQRPTPEASRIRLDQLRAAASRRVAGLTRAFDDIVDATADVATDDEHDPEGHTIAWERQQAVALLDESRTELAAIDEATRRLADGRYGLCSVCGFEIDVERLDALPATSTCVACAR